MRKASERTLFSIVILVLVFLAFGASLWHGFSPIDDHFLITENLAVHGISWENLKIIFSSYDPELYIPATLFTFQLDYVIRGLNPFGYHLTNLLLHAANAILVALLLSQLGIKRILAFGAGVLFVVHPLNAEAVVWIAGRKDTLSTLFTLASIILYVRYVRGSRGAYVGSIVSFILALLSKAMAVTLPVLLLLVDIFPLRRKFSWKILLEKIPYALLSVVFMVIATGGKERVIGSVTLLETILMAGRSSLFYIEKLFLPVGLSVFYTHRGAITLEDSRFFVPWLLLIMALAALSFLAAKKSSRSHPLVIAAWFGSLFFLISLTPTFLNFHKGAETFVAVDRYAYFPMIGILFFFAYILNSFRSRIASAVPFILTAICIPLSIAQTKIWSDPELLYTKALEVHPESLGARVSLAKYYREQGKLQEAFDVLKDGLQYGDASHLHLAVGAVLVRAGRIDDARMEFEKAVTMDPENPEPYYSLGILDEQSGNTSAARAQYEKAVVLDPSYVVARVRLGQLLIKEGKRNEAKDMFLEALLWNRNSVEALSALGLMLQEDGNFDGALEHLQKSAFLDPHNVPVLLALAEIEMTQGHPNEARMYLERVLKVDQRNVDALRMLQE